jgi:hypothetical protein
MWHSHVDKSHVDDAYPPKNAVRFRFDVVQ